VALEAPVERDWRSRGMLCERCLGPVFGRFGRTGRSNQYTTYEVSKLRLCFCLLRLFGFLCWARRGRHFEGQVFLSEEVGYLNMDTIVNEIKIVSIVSTRTAYLKTVITCVLESVVSQSANFLVQASAIEA